MPTLTNEQLHSPTTTLWLVTWCFVWRNDLTGELFLKLFFFFLLLSFQSVKGNFSIPKMQLNLCNSTLELQANSFPYNLLNGAPGNFIFFHLFSSHLTSCYCCYGYIIVWKRELSRQKVLLVTAYLTYQTYLLVIICIFFVNFVCIYLNETIEYIFFYVKLWSSVLILRLWRLVNFSFFTV